MPSSTTSTASTASTTTTTTTTTTTAAAATTTKTPTFHRRDTGCSVTLCADLASAELRHGADAGRCRCMRVSGAADIARLAGSVRCALAEGILECEKPGLAFAMLLLGADVVFYDPVRPAPGRHDVREEEEEVSA